MLCALDYEDLIERVEFVKEIERESVWAQQCRVRAAGVYYSCSMWKWKLCCWCSVNRHRQESWSGSRLKYLSFCNRYACGRHGVSGQVTRCVVAAMALPSLRLFPVTVVTVLMVLVSSSEEHEWLFNPGRTKCFFSFFSFSDSYVSARFKAFLPTNSDVTALPLSLSSLPPVHGHSYRPSRCFNILLTFSDQ